MPPDLEFTSKIEKLGTPEGNISERSKHAKEKQRAEQTCRPRRGVSDFQAPAIQNLASKKDLCARSNLGTQKVLFPPSDPPFLHSELRTPKTRRHQHQDGILSGLQIRNQINKCGWTNTHSQQDCPLFTGPCERPKLKSF